MEVSIWSFVAKKVRDLTVIEFKNLWNLGIIRLESQNLLVFVKADVKMHWSYEAKKGKIAMLPSAANLVKKKKKKKKKHKVTEEENILHVMTTQHFFYF